MNFVPTTELKFLRNSRSSFASLALVAILLLAACKPTQQDGMDHENMEDGEMAMAGMENSSEAMMVTLVPAPEGQDGEYLSVELMDMDGAPITDAMVSLEGNMNHAGMVPVVADGVADDADGAADGVYQVPFEFSMGGDWIITVSAMMTDGSMEMQDVMVSVSEGAVEVQK